MNDISQNSDALEENDKAELIQSEIAKLTPTGRKRFFKKFLLAALGSIPWVGGFISTMASLKTETGDVKADNMRTQWLSEHQQKIEMLAKTLNDIAERFEKLGEQIDERLQSEEYLNIVRCAFRTWDQADTDEKRKYVANLVANASATSLCSDDIVRLQVSCFRIHI